MPPLEFDPAGLVNVPRRRVAWLLAACTVLVTGAGCEDGGRVRPPTQTAVSGSGATAPSGDVLSGQYLTDALSLIQQRAYYADRVDWPVVRAEARRRTAAPTTTAEVHDTIRWVLTKLGDRHSFLLSPERARELAAGGGRSFGLLALFPERVVVDVEPGGAAERAGVRVGDVVESVDGRPVRGEQVVTLPAVTAGGGPARVLLTLRRGSTGRSSQLRVAVEAAEAAGVRPPTARRVSAGTGLLELFSAFTGVGPDAARYIEPAHDAIRRVATRRTCGWVVDLRRNTGGSLPPMLAAVGPILGDGKAVGYRARDGATFWFGYQDGAFTAGGQPDRSLAASRPAQLPGPRPPVAVLTSRLTGSSGEGVVMAFRGRPGARSFGEPTAGVPTGNSPHTLADHAELHLTEAIGVDRTGRIYETRIRPDRPVATDWSRYGTPTDPVLKAATTWLEGRCASR
jgi:C-terminal processing protease CtpA/Prc